MKKFILLFLLCAVSVLAITTAITTSYDTCYDGCKSACVEKFSADECQRNCVLMCKTQSEPSLVDSSVAISTKPTVAMRVSTQPVPAYTCEEKCKIGFSNCGPGYPVTSGCNELLDQCVKNCQPQIAPQPTIVVPPVEISCDRRCWMTQDECKKYGVDDASCKMKIDSCLRGCQSVPQPTCGPCPICPQPGFSCDSECVLGYYKCKSSGADNCGQVIVECLDKCRPILPPVLTCEDQCAKIKQVCFDEKLTEQECAPKIKYCLDECSKPTIETQPVPPTVMKTSVANAEVREPLPAVARQEGEVPPEMPEKRVEEKSFIAKIWSSIFGG